MDVGSLPAAEGLPRGRRVVRRSELPGDLAGGTELAAIDSPL
jgi:hypothetical protein